MLGALEVVESLAPTQGVHFADSVPPLKRWL
jgi:hypothetical protein